MDEDLKKLFEGQEVSDEFLTTLKGILETKLEQEKTAVYEAAKAKASEEFEQNIEEYQNHIIESVEERGQEYIDTVVLESISAYMEQAISEYNKENAPVVESAVKVELADSFLKGFSNLAESYNVKVPEGQDDHMAKLESRIEESNQRVNALLEEKAQLQEQIVESKRKDSMSEVFKDLTESQKERVVKAAKDLKFENKEQFEGALSSLKESYFPEVDDEGEKSNIDNLNENKDKAPADTSKMSYADRLAASL